VNLIVSLRKAVPWLAAVPSVPVVLAAELQLHRRRAHQYLELAIDSGHEERMRNSGLPIARYRTSIARHRVLWFVRRARIRVAANVRVPEASRMATTQSASAVEESQAPQNIPQALPSSGIDKAPQADSGWMRRYQHRQARTNSTKNAPVEAAYAILPRTESESASSRTYLSAESLRITVPVCNTRQFFTIFGSNLPGPYQPRGFLSRTGRFYARYGLDLNF